jgi:hypothetical protein
VRHGRPRAGATDAAIAGIGVAAIGFAVTGHGNSAATLLLCFIGLGLLRVLAGPRFHLLPLALALAALAAIGAIEPIGSAGIWSPVAHFIGGTFVGIALVPVVDRHADRLRLPASRFLTLVGLVLLVGIGWELGEMIVDQLFGTNLSPSTADAALDLVADTAGGAVAAAISGPAWRGRASPTGSPPR